MEVKGISLSDIQELENGWNIVAEDFRQALHDVAKDHFGFRAAGEVSYLAGIEGFPEPRALEYLAKLDPFITDEVFYRCKMIGEIRKLHLLETELKQNRLARVIRTLFAR